MTARSLELFAPAKVNLGLRVTGTRDDGYHELDSLFVPFAVDAGAGLGDLVRVRMRELEAGSEAKVELRLSGEQAEAIGAEPAADNLAIRAANAFLEASGIEVEVEISLEKRVPAGAGLGGGSSDAGTVLAALDQSYPGSLSREKLAELALALGADVPFFLGPEPSRVRGIGDEIAPLSGVPELVLIVAKTPISVATAEVYAAWDAREAALTPSGPRPTMRADFDAVVAQGGFSALLAEAAEGKVAALAAVLRNDLEAAACELCPEVATLRARLEECGAMAAAMTGSGSAVYGVFRSRREAELALAKAKFPAATWARVATTAPSPLDS